MTLFATRRAFNAAKDEFSNNPASLTRYISVPAGVTPDRRHIISQSDWLAKVGSGATSGEILIFVHGFNTEQDEMLSRLGKIESHMSAAGWRGLVLAFDWPSDGSVWAYSRDRRDAKKVAPYFVVDMIGPLLNLSRRPNLHLLCHSMGVYLTLRAFAGVGDSGAPGTTPWGVNEVSFVAADADRAWMELGAWGSLVMDRRCERLTNYYSTFDRVLDLAEGIIHGAARAGRDGMSPEIPARFEDVYCGEQYQQNVPDTQKTLRGSHNWYFEDPGFYADLKLTLEGAGPLNRPTRRPTAGSSDLALLT